MFEQGDILNHRVADSYIRLLFPEVGRSLWVCEIYTSKSYVTIGRLHINELKENFNVKANV